jgi:hypothetical protein
VNQPSDIGWGWRARARPVEPRAVLAWGDAARRLHARLGLLPETRQQRLAVTASRDVVVVLGPPADLPWVDSAAYAAPCEEDARLWVPTLWEPDVPADLLARALFLRHGRQPMLLWPEPVVLIPLDRQLPVSAAQLRQLINRWQGKKS